MEAKDEIGGRVVVSAEAQAFRERWRTVNEAEVEELCATPIEVKARQLAALMVSAKQMEWAETLAAEEAEVRQIWARLRKIYGV